MVFQMLALHWPSVRQKCHNSEHADMGPALHELSVLKRLTSSRS